MRSIFRSQSGMGLVQVMVASGILGVLALGSATMMQNLMKANNQMNAKANALILRDTIRSVVMNEVAWNNILAANGSMSCLLNSTDCNGVAATAFEVRDETNTVLLGYTKDGVPCAGYVAIGATGNNLCPFGVEISFEPTCTGSPCINPSVRIDGRIQYNPENHQFTYNANNYAFTFYRGAQGDGSNTYCSQLGGTFNSTTQQCENIVNISAQQACTVLGGTYSGGSCSNLPGASGGGGSGGGATSSGRWRNIGGDTGPRCRGGRIGCPPNGSCSPVGARCVNAGPIGGTCIVFSCQ